MVGGKNTGVESAVKSLAIWRVRAVALGAYRRANLPFCCDPRDLAEGLGLSVRPANIVIASVEKGVLRFPNRATLPRRGLHIYLAISGHLLRLEGLSTSAPTVRALAMELALPQPVAICIAVSELARVQPHFPLPLLEGLVVGGRASGVMTKNVG